MYPLATATIADLMSDAAGAHELDFLVGNTPVYWGRWVVLAAWFWGYHLNPAERRARKAGKQQDPNIFHLLERTKLT
jgi:hypothetical protein